MALLFNRVALLSLLYPLLLDYFSSYPLTITTGIFSSTPLATLLRNLFFLFSFLTFTFTAFPPRHTLLTPGVEYPLILLFTLIGGALLITAGDFISITISLELQSFGLSILIGYLRNSPQSTSAALTYFLLSGLSSALIFFGFALIYTRSGTLTLTTLHFFPSLPHLSHLPHLPSFTLPLTIVSAGLLLKLGAAPFHFWIPDIYPAIPFPTTIYLAVVSKIPLFALYLTIIPLNPTSLYLPLTLSAILSLVIGALAGLTAFHPGRLLAYSGVAHLGFLLPLLLFTSQNPFALQSFIFYLLIYLFTTLALLYLFSALPSTPQITFSTFNGLYYTDPALAFAAVVTIFSLIGLPPFAGFFAKYYFFLFNLQIGVTVIPLVAVVTGVISTTYYLNFITPIFFSSPPTPTPTPTPNPTPVYPFHPPTYSPGLTGTLTIPLTVISLISLFSFPLIHRLSLFIHHFL